MLQARTQNTSRNCLCRLTDIVQTAWQPESSKLRKGEDYIGQVSRAKLLGHFFNFEIASEILFHHWQECLLQIGREKVRDGKLTTRR